jgi:hypothetical protein
MRDGCARIERGLGGALSRCRMRVALMLLLCGSKAIACAQELQIWNRTVQAHGFANQGFVYTNQNNWLTMNTTAGSFQFSDMGFNLSSQLSPKVTVGGQIYTRNLGQLGGWHPSLDWAQVDFRPKTWLGFRGGKVKTVLGLYNDTQDLDFANTYALLPQSVYPIDLRDATIAHKGGDVYGQARLPRGSGLIEYTAYGGLRSDSMHSGYPYLLTEFGVQLSSYGGPVYGGDLRWSNRTRTLLVGASRLNEDITGIGTAPPLYSNGPPASYREQSKHDWTNQFYGRYARERWRVESEFRRYYRDQMLHIVDGMAEDQNNIKGWYVGGSWRACSWFEAGSYYSHYRDHDYSAILSTINPPVPEPGTRDFDKVVTGKFNVGRFTTIKVEGHFMSGYADEPYPEGFYPQVNPNGFQNTTNALVVRASFSF